ncbi:MAG: helicase-related protein [Fimbriimonadales bacterium]
MPTIIDNIQVRLLDELHKFVESATSARFCVGYFNLRGWDALGKLVENLPSQPSDPPCKVLVGMIGHDRLHPTENAPPIDRTHITQQQKRLMDEFEQQMVWGVPTTQALHSMRRLARQLRTGRVQIKLFVRYPLHAKLYLLTRNDPVTPLIGYVGSSNLTYAGIAQQGELNVDVVDQSAAHQLLTWFEERWNDPTCVDITKDLLKLLEERCWASESLQQIANLPYLVYLKIAYHLSEDARIGTQEFKLPTLLEGKLLDFQVAAVQLASRLLYRHGGVLIGDVVGLGKTLMATAVARIFQEFDDSNTLVICPPKLVPMWESYLQQYHITGRVLSLGRAPEELPYLIRYRTLIIDESHNLRNRDGKRYKAILEYIEQNDPRVILLTATPYNKHYEDLSNQIRLFKDEKDILPVRPERFLQSWREEGNNEADFRARYQAPVESLVAFEQSPYPEDWRDLMRLFMVRRTRQFVINHYAHYDPDKKRHYVMIGQNRYYFPERKPETLTLPNTGSQYDRLYNDRVVTVIENLKLPRYGLRAYIKDTELHSAHSEHKAILEDLSRAGKRLIGFCRTNLFKRLESSGQAFLKSVERHILRNLITLYALENNLEIPIGTQAVLRLDTSLTDMDLELETTDDDITKEIDTQSLYLVEEMAKGAPEEAYQQLYQKAAEYYRQYKTQYKSQFRWLPTRYFHDSLRDDLEQDARALLRILADALPWNPEKEPKLQRLLQLVQKDHQYDKVLIFTEFADTALYLKEYLQRKGVLRVEVITGDTGDPVSIARRFSPKSNGGLRAGEQEIRVLIATDVLSEGQNLQDAHVVVNFDLPWAIIRLIQRAGRVDRIGQTHPTVLVYSFQPAEGVEQIIRLRKRLAQRLQENQEVIGTDETFFGEQAEVFLRDLYAEKKGILDDDSDDTEVDLTSLALEAWNNATEEHRKQAQALPMQVYATRPHSPAPDDPEGIISFIRLYRGEERHDMLVRLDKAGNLVSQSLSGLFGRLSCEPNTPNLPEDDQKLDILTLVARAVDSARADAQSAQGSLGTQRSVRRRLYERLRHALSQSTLQGEQCQHAERLCELLYRYSLKRSAEEKLRQHLKMGIGDSELVDALWQFQEEGHLFNLDDTLPDAQVEVVCTIGMREP